MDAPALLRSRRTRAPGKTTHRAVNRARAAVFAAAVSGVLLGGLPGALQAKPVAAVADSKGAIKLAGALEYFKDETAALSFEAVRTQARFQPIATDSPGFGFTGAAVWLRFALHNPADQATPWLLAAGAPFLSDVQIYVASEGGAVERLRGGAAQPFATRSIRHAGLVFPISLAPASHTDVYLRVQGDEPIQIPLGLYTPSGFNRHERAELLLIGLYLGVLALAFGYNLFLCASTRDRGYLYYILYILASSGYVATELGVAYEYLWPDAPWWNHKAPVVFAGVGMAVAGMFTIEFLNLRTAAPARSRLLKILAFFSLVLCPLHLFLDGNFVGAVFAGLGLLGAFLLFFIGVEQALRKNPSASYYIVAFGAVILGSVVNSLKTAGFLPLDAWAYYSFAAGSAVEITLLSLGLGDRINRLERERRSLKEREAVREAELRALAAEIEVARQIQQSILPHSTPVLSGLNIAARYAPMGRVGGDYYDFFVLSETQLGIMIADVSGHGIPAALVASMLKIACAENLALAQKPAEFLTAVNRSMIGHNHSEFITAAFGMLDIARKELKYANAGHPGLIQASFDGEMAEHRPKGLILGVFADARITSTVVELGAGDRLFFYTDGLYECRNAAEEMFGMQRIQPHLLRDRAPSAETCSENILHALTAWRGGVQEFDDDVTYVVIDVL